MPKESNEKDAISLEELAVANAYELLAITSLLEQKGILTRDEVVNEVKGLIRRTED
ncbi:MAG: hypothetical protein V3U37_04565 [Nitrospinaceae bacterium]